MALRRRRFDAGFLHSRRKPNPPKMSHSTLIVGQSLTDRWATFFIFKHHDDRVGMDLTFACACKTIMDFIMTDEEKQNDFRTRRNRFI